MKKPSLVLSVALAVAGVGIPAVALLTPSVAMAEKVSAKVGPSLKAAQSAIQGRRWDAALAKINEADNVSGKTGFDQYKINELKWYVYLQQGRNGDAARVLEGQLSSGYMGGGEKVQRTKTLAQLYFRAGNYGKAEQYANQYLRSAPGDRDMQLLVATAAYQRKDYKAAIASADRLMKAGGTPSQDLLQLVLRCNYELKDTAGTAAALDQLLKYYPSADTWERVLEGYFAQAKKDNDRLALYRLSESVGALKKPKQYVDMAQSLIIAGFAIEGERIMQKGIDAGLFAGEELNRAKRTLDAAKRKADVERAAVARAPAALASAKTGEELAGIGRGLFSAGDYAKAADAFSRALAKGGLSDADNTNMLLGIALYRQGNKAAASKAFDAVKEPKFAEIAKLWKTAAR